MRVLHVQKVAGIGGSERHLVDLLTGLGHRGVECAMCIIAAGEWQRFAEMLNERGIRWMAVRSTIDIDPTLVVRLGMVMRRWDPDLVHTHLIHADVYGQVAARALGIPAVSSIHSTLDFYKTGWFRNVASLAGRLSRRVIAISEHVARTLVSHRVVPEDRIEVVRYGIDTAQWTVDRETARARLGFANDELVIGAASRLVPNKGHELLLRAFAEACRDLERPRLLLAGDGPLRPRIESLVRRLGLTEVVTLLGFVADVPSFMAACDVVVFPSVGFGEGFGLAALEAQAAGRPVIAFAVDSLPEVVEDRQSGILITPGSVEELASAIVWLGSDQSARDEMGTRARERARSCFSIEQMISGNLAVYEEVLNHR